MINVQVHVHDRFSVEFKIAYLAKREQLRNDFEINTWMFVPNQLDINDDTYSKNQFYRDVKSTVRLITPVYSLDEMASEDALPFQFLKVAFNELAVEPSRENILDAEYHVKMLTSIVKSALRREVYVLKRNLYNEDFINDLRHFIQCAKEVLAHYRELENTWQGLKLDKGIGSFYEFGDEFLSNQVEYYTFRLLDRLKRKTVGDYEIIERELMNLVNDEILYRQSKGYLVFKKDHKEHNQKVLFRLRMLRLYTESHLFLKADRKKDGAMIEQIYFSLAAGISMIFATAISFSFQQKYGNFTIPLFVALVISYMLKDRIKELMRYYFVHRLGKKYFDNKTQISIKDHPLGWMKEGMDFVSESHVPDEIMEMRERSDILEATNRNTAEKVILYRTWVRIDGEALDKNNQYDVSGIHDILRFNISSFILKMENAEVPINIPDDKGGYEKINGERIYYINFLLQLKNDDQISYVRFRLIVSRNGIEGIEKI